MMARFFCSLRLLISNALVADARAAASALRCSLSIAWLIYSYCWYINIQVNLRTLAIRTW